MPAKARSTRTKDQSLQKKADYFEKVNTLLEEYPKFLIVNCDNVGSHLIQQMRLSLRSSGSVLLMGKNTLIKKAMKMRLDDHPEWQQIIPFINQNVGLVFTKSSLVDIRQQLLECTVASCAKSGMIAPNKVVLSKQVTILEPTKTSFFAALAIPTKITKGCVEVLNEITLCEKGKKVGCSEAALLQMLDMKPFSYGISVVQCFNGVMFPPSLLEFSETPLFSSMSDILGKQEAMTTALSYPSLQSFPDVVARGFRNLVAVSLETNYEFNEAKGIKNYLDNLVISDPVDVVKDVDKKPVCNYVDNVRGSDDDDGLSFDLFGEIEDKKKVDSNHDDEEGDEIDIMGFF